MCKSRIESKAQNQRIFLIRPPQPPYPLRNPPCYTNFANFGPIWMKLGVKVKNGEQSMEQIWEYFDVIQGQTVVPTIVYHYIQNLLMRKMMKKLYPPIHVRVG